jgi:phage terminase small subunit
MARPGRKGSPPELMKLKGERRVARQVVNLFGDVVGTVEDEDFPPPAEMTPEAKELWRNKVRRYKARGQKISGFEDMLEIYCEAQAALLEAFKSEGGASAAQINSVRGYAMEFFDTPASQRVKATSVENGANRFTANGQRRTATAA